jgi:hypothetical protein
VSVRLGRVAELESVPLRGASAYASLLSGTRGLKREQQLAREQWFSALSVDRKEDTLFELEILLKGLACFANPRNHPGARQRAVVSHDFRDALGLARDGMTRAIQLARPMLGEHDKAFVFQRYLETVLPEDSVRNQLVTGAVGQASPEDALFQLRHGLTNMVEVSTGLLRLSRVSFRVFYAMMSMAMREIASNAFFNPLSALEFRPEFDRISSAQVLELIHSVPGEQAHRLVALTFLALFRMLRYLRLLDQIVHDFADRRIAGRAYLVLAVLRSDARALSSHLKNRAGHLLAESYERELLRVPAYDIAVRHDELRAEGHRLLGIKGVLTGLAANLRLELRRTFEHDLPLVEASRTDAELRQDLRMVTTNLRPALQSAVLFLGRSLGARFEEGRVFDDQAARRSTSERLRRDVWMFAQITRAFAMKARAANPEGDRWTTMASFAFVREFLAYFRAMGYPLLRAGDYPRVDAFMAAIGGLEENDAVDAAKLEAAVAECEAFYLFLVKLFESISQRDELSDVPFDRLAAAKALKLYLGDRGGAG